MQYNNGICLTYFCILSLTGMSIILVPCAIFALFTLCSINNLYVLFFQEYLVLAPKSKSYQVKLCQDYVSIIQWAIQMGSSEACIH